LHLLQFKALSLQACCLSDPRPDVCLLMSQPCTPFRAWRLFRGLRQYIYACLYLETLFTCLCMFVKFVHIFMHICKVWFIYLCAYVLHSSCSQYIYIYTLTSLWSVCAGCTCVDILSLTHPHRNSSPRGLVSQRVDEDIQGAEPPYHPKRLVGFSLLGINFQFVSRNNCTVQ
jgi:hypothetical protein